VTEDIFAISAKSEAKDTESLEVESFDFEKAKRAKLFPRCYS